MFPPRRQPKLPAPAENFPPKAPDLTAKTTKPGENPRPGGGKFFFSIFLLTFRRKYGIMVKVCKAHALYTKEETP